jgi:hypothetical protein
VKYRILELAGNGVYNAGMILSEKAVITIEWKL